MPERPYPHIIETGQNSGFTWTFSVPSAQSQFHLSLVETDTPDDVILSINIGTSTLTGRINSQTGTTSRSFEWAGTTFTTTTLWPTMSQLRTMTELWLRHPDTTWRGEGVVFCDDCYLPRFVCGGVHLDCANCSDHTAMERGERFTVYMDDSMETEEFIICATCVDDGWLVTNLSSPQVSECTDCNEFFLNTARLVLRYMMSVGNNRRMCEPCADEYWYCEECGRRATDDEIHRDDYGDIMGCNGCRNGGDDRLVYEWNYRPTMIFHPEIPVDPTKPLYIGMELEIGWDNWNYDVDAQKWLKDMKDSYNGLLYAKSDSSINDGFEVVTHPMDPVWAMENMPFALFQHAIDTGAQETNTSCGTHIHIDRDALTAAQMWKLLKVHTKLSNLCGVIGGRGTDAEYGSFSAERMRVLTKNALNISKKKGEAFGRMERYTAINLQNDQTVELRYMEGSIRPNDIKKNIQWVQALYAFTNYITVSDVKAGVLEDQNFLLGYLLDGNWPELAAHVNKAVLMPISMPVRS